MDSETLRVTICGRLDVACGDTLVGEESLPARQGRRLWAYLVLNRRRPVGRDELAEALWGDDIPDAWDTSLNAIVSRLRAVLRPVAVCAKGLALRGVVGRYQLEMPAEALVDRERAWDAIHHVRAFRRAGDVRGAWAEAVIATEIAARGFLAGEEAPWIEAERRILRDIELQALEAVADAEVAQGRAVEAQHVARRLVTTDPLREAGYRLLMRAHQLAGNGAAAAEVLEECRTALSRVGATPSSETERVYREVTGAR